MTASMANAAGRRRLLQDADSAGDDAAAPRAEPDWGANPFVGTIKVPPATFPLKVGIWGDPGQVRAGFLRQQGVGGRCKALSLMTAWARTQLIWSPPSLKNIILQTLFGSS
jgi:hypothetical protein